MGFPRRRARRRGWPSAAAAVVASALAGALAAAEPGGADAGIVLVLDPARLELSARDARDGVAGPRLPVAVGSPAQPTPVGVFPLERVILKPGWTPAASARAAGARPEPPSISTPMGVAKIPFAGGGEIALHGGGRRALLGMPVSAGCVRAADADLLRLLAWLHARGALGTPVETEAGEVHRRFARPAELRVRFRPAAAVPSASMTLSSPTRH